jgi:hypothetical protein
MENDRTERQNLVKEEQELAAKLIAQWETWAARSDVGPWPGPARADWGDVPRPRAARTTTQ